MQFFSIQQKTTYKESILLTFSLSLYYIIYYKIFISFPIHPDEAYYWEWSRHLSNNYLDHGPGIAYWIKAFTLVFGDTKQAFLLSTVFAGFSLFYFAYWIARRCGLSQSYAYLIIVSIAITPLFFIGSSILTPDAGMLLSIVCATYYFIGYIQTKSARNIIFTFIFCGIALLFKITVLYFGFVIFLWLLFFDRKIFFRPAFYVGGLIAFIVISPMLFTDVNLFYAKLYHYSHLFSREFRFPFDLLGGHLLSFGIIWYLLFLFLFIHKSWDFFTESRKKLFSIKPWQIFKNLESWEVSRKIFAFLWMNIIVLETVAFLLGFQRDIQINWLLPIYLPIILICVQSIFTKHSISMLGFVDKNKVLKIRKRWFLKALYWTGFGICISMNLFVFYGDLLFKDIPNHWLVKNRNRGFQSILLQAEKYIEPLDKDEWLLAAPRYQDAAISSWYLQKSPQVYSLQLLRKDQYSYIPYDLNRKNKFFIIALTTFNEEDYYLGLVTAKLNTICRKWEKTKIYRYVNEKNKKKEYLKSGQFYYCYL